MRTSAWRIHEARGDVGYAAAILGMSEAVVGWAGNLILNQIPLLTGSRFASKAGHGYGK
jgi:hypothetical protein